MEPLPYGVSVEVYIPMHRFNAPRLCAALAIVDSAPDGCARLDVPAIGAAVRAAAGDDGLPDRRVCVTIYRVSDIACDTALLAAHIWREIGAVSA